MPILLFGENYNFILKYFWCNSASLLGLNILIKKLFQRRFIGSAQAKICKPTGFIKKNLSHQTRVFKKLDQSDAEKARSIDKDRSMNKKATFAKRHPCVELDRVGQDPLKEAHVGQQPSLLLCHRWCWSRRNRKARVKVQGFKARRSIQSQLTRITGPSLMHDSWNVWD